ncbi:hypothetical protein U9M48_026275 [Paspalum notatum var. saurae]|uniref:Dihydrolipoyl dehydrogenase n=1 Tax=Paspalum notatum var. saurae TaxID=547442 RepID=A0AAQ3TQK7_PASNO
MAMMRLGRRHISAALLRQPLQPVLAWVGRGYAALPEPWSDVIVVGGGPGGYVTAVKAAQLGLKTTCIEMPGILGGSCSGLGCIPSSCSIDGKKILSPVGALLVEEIPTKAIIVGAGYSAIEMASVWSHLGSEVLLIDPEPHVAPYMDGEFRKMFMETLVRKGIHFMLGTKLLESDTTSTCGVRVLVEPTVGGDKTMLEADLLVLSCDEPDIDCLGLNNVGMKKDRTGKIIVNDRFMTNCHGIFAIGSYCTGPLIPHKAEEDGVCCANIIAGREMSVNYDLIPSVIYALPEIAYIGDTEEKLKASGVQYTVCKFELHPNGIFKLGQERTLKVLCEKKSGHAVGIHLMGPNAGEMVRESIGSLRHGASSTEIARVCNSDGTRNAIRVSCFQAYLNAIHT